MELQNVTPYSVTELQCDGVTDSVTELHRDSVTESPTQRDGIAEYSNSVTELQFFTDTALRNYRQRDADTA